jgi:multicomponent Na+:H+ antiporter subunit E
VKLLTLDPMGFSLRIHMKNYIISILVLFAAWLMLSGSLASDVLLFGALFSLIISLMFAGSHKIFKDIKLNPKSFIYFILYIFVLTWEIFKSNLDVARRVISPTIPINPGVVKIKTDLKTPIARLILANSITLTPGTLTVSIDGDTLLIHWIDVKSKDLEKTTKKIASSFEKYLEVIYG